MGTPSPHRHPQMAKHPLYLQHLNAHFYKDRMQ